MIPDCRSCENFGYRMAFAFVVALVLACVRPLWAQSPDTLAVEPVVPQGDVDTRPATRPGETASTQEGDERPLTRVAHIRLGGTVLQSPSDFTLFADTSGYMTVRDWLKRLADARRDENLSAVALEIDDPMMTWAQANEIADAVRRLNDVKPVYTYITDGGPTEYLVASAGRKVMMEPSGMLNIVGVGGEMMFFAGTLDWLGVEAQMIQVGRFKGAEEPLTRHQPSAEYKSQLSKVIDDLYEQMCGQIAEHRGLETGDVKQIIDYGPFTARRAQYYKLVDGLVRKIRWRSEVNNLLGGEEGQVSWLDDYAKKSSAQVEMSNPLALMSFIFKGAPRREIRAPTVAVVHADGIIVPGRSGTGFFGGKMVGAQTLVRCFKQMRDDDRIKAVIFRIDSPGGSAVASELIYQAVRSCDKKKPVIASISQTGASGGYYIAAGARKILADKSALVGSIGVVGGKLSVEGLYEKLRIGTWRYARGRNAGIWSSGRWTKSERAAVEKILRSTYDRFVERVKKSRGGRIEDIGSVASGRVFTARQGCENGLIDGLGGIYQAVAAAHKAANLDKSYFITRPRPRTLADVLFNSSGAANGYPELLGANSSPAITSVRRLLVRRPGAEYLLSLAELLRTERVLAAMPYYLSVSR